LIVLNSIFPVFGLVLLGVLLKKAGMTGDAFLSTSDRLIYYVFFPLMLFWKIGGAAALAVDWKFIGAAFSALGLVYFLSWVCIRTFGISDFQAGTFSQSCYRFNTYIGMAVILNALGEEGVRIFGVLIGMMIPVINLLAVTTLIWYSGMTYSAGERNRLLVKALVSNPLIIGCVAGILYANFVHAFPVFLDNTLRLASMVTLPLALLSIGGSLSFQGFKSYYRQSLAAVAVKLAVLPAGGYLFFRLFQVDALQMQVGLIYFALPTSTAIYVLSSQLNSDTRLASASIVISTLLSIVSLTVVLALI
jgi:hypothetical protein